jgi:hypothetical protein
MNRSATSTRLIRQTAPCSSRSKRTAKPSPASHTTRANLCSRGRTSLGQLLAWPCGDQKPKEADAARNAPFPMLNEKAALQAKLQQSERANQKLLERLGTAVKENNCRAIHRVSVQPWTHKPRSTPRLAVRGSETKRSGPAGQVTTERAGESETAREARDRCQGKQQVGKESAWSRLPSDSSSLCAAVDAQA